MNLDVIGLVWDGAVALLTDNDGVLGAVAITPTLAANCFHLSLYGTLTAIIHHALLLMMPLPSQFSVSLQKSEKCPN
jgi:hypothetical protein